MFNERKLYTHYTQFLIKIKTENWLSKIKSQLLYLHSIIINYFGHNHLLWFRVVFLLLIYAIIIIVISLYTIYFFFNFVCNLLILSSYFSQHQAILSGFLVDLMCCTLYINSLKSNFEMMISSIFICLKTQARSLIIDLELQSDNQEKWKTQSISNWFSPDFLFFVPPLTVQTILWMTFQIDLFAQA